MWSSAFYEVWARVRQLTPEERCRLAEGLRALVAKQRSDNPEDRLQLKLFEDGLLSEIKPPVMDFSAYQNRKPVEVKGKPLSEIIVEERR